MNIKQIASLVDICSIYNCNNVRVFLVYPKVNPSRVQLTQSVKKELCKHPANVNQDTVLSTPAEMGCPVNVCTSMLGISSCFVLIYRSLHFFHPIIIISVSNLCQAHGDPHYVTFDGATLHYQGLCRHLLAGVCGADLPANLPQFDIK